MTEESLFKSKIDEAVPNINRPSGVLVTIGERPIQRDMS